MTDQVKSGIRLEELLQQGSNWVEVIHGELVEVEMTAGFIHGIVISNLLDILKPFVQEHGLGRVPGGGLTYILHTNKYGVQSARIPDVSFIRKENMPHFDFSLPFPGAPDLAVEIVSPTESTSKVMEKVTDYLRFGSGQVWVIYPIRKELHQYFRDDNVLRVYTESEILEAPTLFPGLKIAIAELFTVED